MPKGLFIGLGGTGIHTVARLKAILCQREYNSNKNAMYNDCNFIFYDTDYKARDEVNKDIKLTKMMGDSQVIDYARSEFVDAGDTSPYNLYTNAQNASIGDDNYQRLLDWAIEPNDHFHFSQKQLREGAGAIRMEGRTAIFTKEEDLETRIIGSLNGMRQLYNQAGQLTAQDAAIWIFASCNGGTSSSALMDVLYLVDRLYKTHVTNDNPYLRLVLYMPKEFIDYNNKNTETYSINAFSTLWELNEFRLDCMNRMSGGNKFGAFAVRPDKKEWKNCNPWPVYSYTMAIDTESQKSGKISVYQMYDNTAELCYFLHTSAAGGTMVSQLDNDLQNPTFKDNPKKVADSEFEWTKSIVGIGYKAISKADDYLKSYVRTRLRYDLFGYGLLGFGFSRIHGTEESRNKAISKFAKEYILKPLIDIDKFSNSDNNTLYGRYKKLFDDGTTIPDESEVPSKDIWPTLGTDFINECNRISDRLENIFIDSTKDYSSLWYCKEIEKQLKTGIEEIIINYGLNYAYDLIAFVDDEFCEGTVMEKLQHNNPLLRIKADIETIIQEQKPKKGILSLVQNMKDYKQASINHLALNHIVFIIQNITRREFGLLEYLRAGDQNNHTGIKGLINAFNNELGSSRTDFQNLASTFAKTSLDTCSDYFPKVSDFVVGQTWVRNNQFEQLYASILPLDYSKGATTIDKNCELGCPPVRRNDDGRGLSAVLKEIESQTIEGSSLFFEMVMSDPHNSFPEIMARFKDAIDSYLESVFCDGSNLVNQWLAHDLPWAFNKYFESLKADDARTNYINEFTANIPVFYPIRSGNTPNVQTRLLYVGATEAFAGQMGYQVRNDMQYRSDNSIGNRFLVCKLEVGHNFYDYKYFPFISTYYNQAKLEIEAQHKGCHIHKAFVKRDIKKAYEKVMAKKFDDFIKLCWFDSYFEFLNAHEKTKEILEAIFGKEQVQDDWTHVSDLKVTKKDVDEWDLDSDDTMDDIDDLSENENVSDDFIESDIDITDIDDISSTDFDIEDDVELGYRPIVEIENNGSFVVRVNKLKKSAACLVGFSTEDPYEISFRATNLNGIRKEIIKGLNLDYTNEYFKLLSEKFTGSEMGLTKEMCQKLVKVHAKYSDNIFNVFKQKISLILRTSKHKSERADSIAFRMLQNTIKNIKGKDIFK